MEKVKKLINWFTNNLGMMVSILVGLILAWVLSPILEAIGWIVLTIAVCILVYSFFSVLADKYNWTWF